MIHNVKQRYGKLQWELHKQLAVCIPCYHDLSNPLYFSFTLQDFKAGPTLKAAGKVKIMSANPSRYNSIAIL